MPDTLFAFSVALGLLAILALWVPALDLLRSFLRNYSSRRQKD